MRGRAGSGAASDRRHTSGAGASSGASARRRLLAGEWPARRGLAGGLEPHSRIFRWPRLFSSPLLRVSDPSSRLRDQSVENRRPEGVLSTRSCRAFLGFLAKSVALRRSRLNRTRPPSSAASSMATAGNPWPWRGCAARELAKSLRNITGKSLGAHPRSGPRARSRASSIQRIRLTVPAVCGGPPPVSTRAAGARSGVVDFADEGVTSRASVARPSAVVEASRISSVESFTPFLKRVIPLRPSPIMPAILHAAEQDKGQYDGDQHQAIPADVVEHVSLPLRRSARRGARRRAFCDVRTKVCLLRVDLKPQNAGRPRARLAFSPEDEAPVAAQPSTTARCRFGRDSQAPWPSECPRRNPSGLPRGFHAPMKRARIDHAAGRRYRPAGWVRARPPGRSRSSHVRAKGRIANLPAVG